MAGGCFLVQLQNARALVVGLSLLFPFQAKAGVNRWTRITPAGGPGAVASVAACPDIAACAFATTAEGIYATRDGGLTWTLSDLGLGPGELRDVAVSASSGRIAYVLAPSRGLFRTLDRGRSWALVGSELFVEVELSLLAVDPLDPLTVYVGLDSLIHRSRDAGGSWVGVFFPPESGGVSTLAVDPRDSGILYSGTRLLGVLKSVDSGDHWLPGQGLPFPGVTAIAVDPRNSRILYAIAPPAVAKSTDGGSTWKIFPSAPAAATAIAVDPSDDRIVYVAGDDGDGRTALFRSDDGGLTWSPVLVPDPSGPITTISPSSSEPGTVWVAGARLWKTVDGGAHWTSPTRAPVGGLLLLPGQSVLLAAGGGNRLSRSLDFGVTWSPAAEGLPSEPLLCLQEESRDGSLLAATASSIFRSGDIGASWTLAQTLRPGTTSVALDPNQEAAIYTVEQQCEDFVGCSGSALASADGGATWTGIAGESRNRLGRIFLSKATPRRIYAYGSLIPLWFGLAPGPLDGNYLAPHLAVVDDPTNSFHLLGVNGEGVFESLDGGPSWTLVDGSKPPPGYLASTILDPSGRALYVGTSGGGVYRTEDRGRTWAAFNEGLDRRTILSLAFSADGRTLYAGTVSSVHAYTFCASCPARVDSLRPPTRALPARPTSTP
jgi:photosystem II stability/assembly factor-like uncharacterized protein